MNRSKLLQVHASRWNGQRPFYGPRTLVVDKSYPTQHCEHKAVQWPLDMPGLFGAIGGRSPGRDGSEGTGRAGGAGLETEGIIGGGRPPGPGLPGGGGACPGAGLPGTEGAGRPDGVGGGGLDCCGGAALAPPQLLLGGGGSRLVLAGEVLGW